MNIEFLSIRWRSSRLIRRAAASCTSMRSDCRFMATPATISTASRSAVASPSASGPYPRPPRPASAPQSGRRSGPCRRYSIEFDVGHAAAVIPAAQELEQAGFALLHPPRTESWGQTVARLQSPEGAIVGISYAPVLHDEN